MTHEKKQGVKNVSTLLADVEKIVMRVMALEQDQENERLLQLVRRTTYDKLSSRSPP
ncbi:hypothetical protein J4457_03170 [Candidatus Woesearchaeota archaeon]|nr:hypothetical protein [Candidatus Woesearchaeota archaeon]